MNKNTIICANCRHCRKSGATPIACLSIGNIQLAGLYGKCRRFKPRKVYTNRELCPSCANFLPLPDCDGCLHDIADTEVTTDCTGVIQTCRHYQRNLFANQDPNEI